MTRYDRFHVLAEAVDTEFAMIDLATRFCGMSGAVPPICERSDNGCKPWRGERVMCWERV